LEVFGEMAEKEEICEVLRKAIGKFEKDLVTVAKAKPEILFTPPWKDWLSTLRLIRKVAKDYRCIE